MSDDEWDVSDSEVPVAPQKVASKWDDEDVEDEDVKVEELTTVLEILTKTLLWKQLQESWDAESDDDSASSKSKTESSKKSSPLPPKKKTTLQQKLALRKEQEAEKVTHPNHDYY